MILSVIASSFKMTFIDRDRVQETELTLRCITEGLPIEVEDRESRGLPLVIMILNTKK